MTTALENIEFAGIEPADPTDAALLDNLQGNILKGHGRGRVALILLKFSRQPAHVTALRSWIRRLRVTSGARQLADSAAFRATGRGNRLFIGFYLSATGYQALGIPLGQWPRDIAFRQGMKRASIIRLSDPPINQWELPYRGDVDAMLLLAHNDPAQLIRRLPRVRSQLAAVDRSAVITLETGITLRNAQHQATEHFGFADGISQPLFLKSDIDNFRATAPSGAWDPTGNPFHLVLIDDPMAPGHYGSYLVFRKLEQDVERFSSDLLDLARKLNDGTPDIDLTGALVVGRFKNGTPVVLHSSPAADRDRDSFTYVADYGGFRCPLQAHARSMNPRSHDPVERSRRVARRGIPYGDPKGSGPKGLLFLCFQQDISRQFEYIQAIWANNPYLHQHVRKIGLDALIGQPSRGQLIAPQPWPRSWGDPSGAFLRVAFGGHVTMRGGEYFFAPSIPALRSL